MPYYFQNPRAIGDPNIFSIGDPNIYSPKVYVPPELFRFMRWNGAAMQAVSTWVPLGFELCSDAAALGVKMPSDDLHLISSTRGWFTTASGTAAQWFAFLGCGLIEPWKSNFHGKG